MSPSALRKLIAAVLSAFAVFVVVTFLLLGSYPCAHPLVKIPQKNRDKFARVAILVDGTASVGAESFPPIKRIVQRQVIPSLGFDDIAIAFDVQPSFSAPENEVFGLSQDQMPQDPETRAKILETLKHNRQQKDGKVDEEMYDLIREMETYRDRISAVRKAWSARVEARQSPDLPGSEICGALNEIGRWLMPEDRTADRWLLVFSDLRQERAAQACHPDLIPQDTKIILIYSPRAQPTSAFWKPFFGQRNIQWLPLSVEAGGPLLPPSPLDGIEPHLIPTMSDCASHLLQPALLTGGALLATIWLPVLAFERRDRKRRS